jgi:hypothetical protein
MSIGENWLAPQPTANIANAILTQARGCCLVTITAAIGSQGRGAASGPFPHPPFNPNVRLSG